MNGLNHQIASHQTVNPGLIPCIWMQAGVVDYKLCDRDYDCELCPFDEALHTRSSQQALRETRAQFESTIVQGCGVEPDLFYHPAHTWARIEEGGVVRAGLDDFGQRILGRAYSISLPALRTTVQAGSECSRLTHQAGVSFLIAPVTGNVKEVNSKLLQRPGLMNRDAYGEGWLMLIEPDDLKLDLKRLIYGERVRAWLQDEIERLQSIINGDQSRMNDGGWLTPGFMSELTETQRNRVIDSFFPLAFDEEAKSNNAIKFPNGR
jgi:glycine cleavage system H lipoate-binding protein